MVLLVDPLSSNTDELQQILWGNSCVDMPATPCLYPCIINDPRCFCWDVPQSGIWNNMSALYFHTTVSINCVALLTDTSRSSSYSWWACWCCLIILKWLGALGALLGPVRPVIPAGGTRAVPSIEKFQWCVRWSSSIAQLIALYTGWWFGTFLAFSHINWLANHPNWLSDFSEGWPNHQAVYLAAILSGPWT